MTAIAILPARGGSIRIPKKNIRVFRGHPMIHYPIEAAKRSGLFKAVVVTTDDDEIEEVALKCGAVVIRRPADDGTRGTQDVAREVLTGDFTKIEQACVIYPCSPLLGPNDLRIAHRKLQHTKASYVVSVDADPLQDAGCFYFGDADAFRAGLPLYDALTVAHALPPARCIDINTESDWMQAALMFDKLKEGN